MITNYYNRKDIMIVCFVLALFSLVPLFREELYPFSRFGLFTSNPKFLVIYEAHNLEGKKISSADLWLKEYYVGVSNSTNFGVIKPPSIIKYDKISSYEELLPLIQQRLMDLKIPVVKVTQKIYSAANNSKFEMIEENVFVFKATRGVFYP